MRWLHDHFSLVGKKYKCGSFVLFMARFQSVDLSEDFKQNVCIYLIQLSYLSSAGAHDLSVRPVSIPEGGFWLLEISSDFINQKLKNGL